MIRQIQKYHNIPPAALLDLETRMLNFYSKVQTNYYDTSFELYTKERVPYHCDLVNFVHQGMEVLDYGCGSGHFGHNIMPRGARYTGLEWSDAQRALNKKKMPDAEFLHPDAPINRQFDLVTSIHVIEHVVHPEKHLQTLYDLARPGAHIAVLCPDFVNCGSFPKSVFFGATCERLSLKIKKLRVADAFEHLLDLFIYSKIWHKRAVEEKPGSFWINLNPRVLHDGDFLVDADAVHLTRYEDIENFFLQKGARIVRSSRNMPEARPEVSRFNMYILARKPLS